jgi:sugar lactone lactonase YvrE
LSTVATSTYTLNDITQIITTVAGIGPSGYTGDGGPAISAQFSYPVDAVPDGVGNFYIADLSNSAVRKVAAAGTITTIAGNGTQGYSGDGGPATSALLSEPAGLALDCSGNLYIADVGNNTVREVTPEGVISTVAGNGTAGYSGDGGPASSAELNYPRNLAFDASGNLYIADFYNNAVRKVTPAGTITTIAGNGAPGFSGDGGPATSATLTNPAGVAVDRGGNLYITDDNNERIRKVTPSGTISTYAGTGAMSFCGDGGPATDACFFYPNTIAVDASGNLYITDYYNNRIRMVDPFGTITTVAGSGVSGGPSGSYDGDGGPATSAQLNGPGGVSLDANGNLYIADTGNNRIRKVTISGVVLSKPFGHLDSAVDSVTKSATVGQSDSVVVSGWAADVIDGAPLSNVTAYIDGNLIGTPTLGIARPDVAAAQGIAYLDSGYTMTYTVTALSLGSHAVTVIAIDSGGLSTTFGPLAFTVAATAGAPPPPPPFGHLDSAEDSATASSTVAQSGSVVMRGWVADKIDGAPLSNVKVYIDGNLIGTPTLGIARPDVAAAQGAAYLDSGYQLTYSAATLALGSHAVTVIAIDSGGRSTTFGPLAFTVAAAAGAAPPTPPFGHFDSAVDSVTKSATVGQSDSVVVSGWAADVIDGAPLSNVTAYIDGNLIGTPTLGIARPDVTAAYNNAAYTNSGYSLTYAVAALSLGSHGVTVVAIDSGGRSTTFGPLMFTVAAAAGGAPPFGHLDSAVDSVNESSTVGQSDAVVVKGWAADLTDGAPLSNVKVYIDGDLAGTPTLGIARLDVAAADGAAYLDSGYTLTYSVAALSLGSHAVTVIAIDAGGRSTTFGPLDFTVAATAGPAPPFGHLDSAVDNVTASSTVAQSDSVVVKGWAADLTDGAPLSNVKVYIDGNLAGTPTLGIARPDVAAADGATYLDSGYSLTYSAATLALGLHSVTVIAINSGGRSTTFGPLDFTVH